MKKIFISYFLTLALCLFYLSFNVFINTYKFNSPLVKKNIEFLSSDYFRGRLAGTLENEEAAALIKAQFIKNNLKPFGGNYYESFKTNYPHRTTGSAYLKIQDKNGKTIKNYLYNEDFKEDMLNFKNNNILFTNKNELIEKENIIKVTKGEDSFIFYVPDDNKLEFRSSFVSDSPYSMLVMITKNTCSEISNYLAKGYSVNCFIPYESKETTLNNVVGFIEGKHNNAAPVILSAHFDHVGTDLSNTIYNGALDNASGISFLLELNKYINSLGKPERNIIFVAFNAEEFGCIGSANFVNEYKESLVGSKAFNFDMIGSDNGVPLCIMGAKTDTSGTPLIKSTASICNSEKIFFNYLFEDASDHEAFRKNNIDAITFCDNDMSKIHTPYDKASLISTTAIDRCFKVASREVIKYGFGDNIILVYYKSTLIVSLVLIIVLSILYYLQLKKLESNIYSK